MENKDFSTTLNKLKTRGYWKINFYPKSPNPKVIGKVLDAKEIVKNSAIELRGWDYPHFPTQTRKHQDIYVAGDKIEAWIDWENYKEVWRIYQSGQFIHLFGLREDWYEKNSWIPKNDPCKKNKPGSVVSVLGVVYSITEIFAFLRNLAEAGIYEDGAVVEISLQNTKDRSLIVMDPMRAPLFGDYKCRIGEIELTKKTFEKAEVIDDYLNLALDTMVDLFQQFNWSNIPLAVIEEDQKKLIERRI